MAPPVFIGEATVSAVAAMPHAFMDEAFMGSGVAAVGVVTAVTAVTMAATTAVTHTPAFWDLSLTVGDSPKSLRIRAPQHDRGPDSNAERVGMHLPAQL